MFFIVYVRFISISDCFTTKKLKNNHTKTGDFSKKNFSEKVPKA